VKKELKLVRKPPDGLSIPPTFLIKRTDDSSHGIKRLQREADHLSNIEFKNDWSYNPTHMYDFMECKGTLSRL